MSATAHRYFVLNKPFNMVSQFVSVEDVNLLGDLDFDFPEGTHAIGRLDSLSEGLLILTTNKKVTKLLFQGKTPHKRTYLVRVRNIISPENVQKLRDGVTIRIRGGGDYLTPPCEVHLLNTLPNVFPHQLEQYPALHSWLTISLYEGKFHQVRKMVSALNHPCRRLIRTSIEDLHLGDLAPGCIRELEEKEFFSLLKIDDWDK